ncbi:MAG: cytochrome P460 family protein [Planctomycetes bacterium]|nr:cytochrome P460 family protein [Planctomycetota bacterium]
MNLNSPYSKTYTFCFAGFLSLLGLTTTTLAWTEPDHSESLSRLVADLDQFHRVTDKPHRMADSTAELCAVSYNTHIHEGIGETAYCHVYVTANGKEVLTSGKGNYPIGSVIVKSKLQRENSNDAILYTVMRKMSEGYDSDNGDWEYTVLDGPSKRVLASGKIDSCIACHKSYSASDYVTREYLKDNPSPSKKRNR